MGDLSLSFPPLSDFPRASVSNIKGFVNWLSTKIEVCPLPRSSIRIASLIVRGRERR